MKERVQDPEALPLIMGRAQKNAEGKSEPIPFRFAGFGKYRNNNSQQRKTIEDGSDGCDTDGQWDSGVDADGHGGNGKAGRR